MPDCNAKSRRLRDVATYYRRSSAMLFFFLVFNRNLNVKNIFGEKTPNVKFHEKTSVGSRLVPCGRTDIQTVTSVLVVDLCNGFAISPKNPAYCYII